MAQYGISINPHLSIVVSLDVDNPNIFKFPLLRDASLRKHDDSATAEALVRPGPKRRRISPVQARIHYPHRSSRSRQRNRRQRRRSLHQAPPNRLRLRELDNPRPRIFQRHNTELGDSRSGFSRESPPRRRDQAR